MCLISVPNFKEIHLGEDYFFPAQSYCFKLVRREEKYKENRAIFRNSYFKNYSTLIFFKFGMASCVYGGHKIHKFDRNWSSSYRDTSC